MDLDQAFQRFFKYKNGYPKFKKKNTKKSCRIPQCGNHIKFDFETKKIKIPKIDTEIKRFKNKQFAGNLKSIKTIVTTIELERWSMMTSENQAKRWLTLKLQ